MPEMYTTEEEAMQNSPVYHDWLVDQGRDAEARQVRLASDKIEEVKDLLGHVLRSMETSADNEQMAFTLADGRKFMLYHEQHCCESVSIDDVCGNLEDLVGLPLPSAEESTNGKDNPPDARREVIEGQESFTWTFYRFATVRGQVTIRWYGASNGYYSESVDFREIK